MIRCAITDRRQCPVLDTARRVFEAGADFLQIREKDLTERELLQLTRDVLALANPHGTGVLVNTRADIALATGAHGVHLPSYSIAPSLVRRLWKDAQTVITVACHSLDDVRRAELEGADYAIFSPIFAVEGKGPAQGIEMLRKACRSVRIPVIALGGVTQADIAACLEAGAAGIAGIRLFGYRAGGAV